MYAHKRDSVCFSLPPPFVAVVLRNGEDNRRENSIHDRHEGHATVMSFYDQTDGL